MEVYHQVTLNEWMDMKEQLRRELNNVRTACVRVGYVLRQMEDTKGYEAEGYKSVAEFAEKEHGLKPSTTSRWMSINREYSLDGYSMQLDPRYLGMNASQLTEMLGLPMEDRELITPNTPREDIRELKRLEKMPECPEGFEVIVRHFFETNPDALDWLIDAMDKGAEEKDLIEIVSPSGNKAYRKDGAMIFLMEKAVKFKRAGHSPEEVQYAEFFAIAKTIAEEREEEEAENGTVSGEPNDGGDYREGEGSPAEIHGEDETLSGENPGTDPENRTSDRGDNGYSETDSESGDKEGEPDHEPADDEDAGSGRDEETEDGNEEAGQLETGDDADNSSDAEAEPVAEEPEAAAGEMNPPIAEKEAVAPAQQKPKKAADISKIPPIVDEKGQPAPEEQSLDIRVMRVEASQICRDLSNNIGWRNWKKAMECVEMLQPKLRELAFHDK